MTHAVLSQASQSSLITHISVFAVLEFCVMVQVAAPSSSNQSNKLDLKPAPGKGLCGATAYHFTWLSYFSCFIEKLAVL